VNGLCDGCNVREPFEHRCHGAPCPCEECREADRLFGGPLPGCRECGQESCATVHMVNDKAGGHDYVSPR
jgi:hypothetical protein